MSLPHQCLSPPGLSGKVEELSGGTTASLRWFCAGSRPPATAKARPCRGLTTNGEKRSSRCMGKGWRAQQSAGQECCCPPELGWWSRALLARAELG